MFHLSFTELICLLHSLGLEKKGQLSHVDHVTTNAHPSQGESQLYILNL